MYVPTQYCPLSFYQKFEQANPSRCLFQETKELAALAYRDSTEDNRKFWKSEMTQALREIQDTYDEKLKSMRGDLESSCHFKVG